MRESNLRQAVLLSGAIHLIVFLMFILVLKPSNRIVIPSLYTVNLVSSDVLRKESAGAGRVDRVMEDAVQSVAQTAKEARPKNDIEQRQIKEDRIMALAAKKNIEKRIELRRMISLRAGSYDHGERAAAASSNAKGDLFEDYYRKITQEIWQQWVYPDISRKDIEAIVSIKILKDGTALVQKVEKSSGNALFDRSALKALAKASPLAPPPYEMDVGVRFYP